MSCEAPKAYRRPIYDEILERADEPRRFIQVLAGPRQVGKTTLARQVMDAIGIPGHFASADAPDPEDIGWIYTQWQIGRQAARNGGRAGGLLVLDEVQKIRSWSDVVKQLWDEDTAGRQPAAGHAPRVGAAAGPPGPVGLAGRPLRDHPCHALVVRRDARRLRVGPRHLSLLRRLSRRCPADQAARAMGGVHPRRDRRDEPVARHPAPNRVEKPALLRQLFRLACTYSGQVLSYTKMLGTLTDAGNTVTLAHYLELLGGAGMVTGIGKYAGRRAPSRLVAEAAGAEHRPRHGRPHARPSPATRADPELWARLVETAVGAHLWAHADPDELGWWREGNAEVDWVVRPGKLLRRAMPRSPSR